MVGGSVFRIGRIAVVLASTIGLCVAGTGTAGADASTTVAAFGMVISVNGSTAAGSCGVAGVTGTYTVMRRNTAQTVIDVAPSTGFVGRGLTSPTFANVCVGEMVSATGTVSGSAFNATDVMIWSPVPPSAVVAFGMVISVDGSTAPGACGSAGTSETYTVMRRRNTAQTVVDVAPSTGFYGRGLISPTFANVCVGEVAGATGAVSEGIFTATDVTIWSSRPPRIGWGAFGIVVSVNGSTDPGVCGVAGAAGTFTVMRRNTSQRVIDVSATTKYRERGGTSPSFADVCVNATIDARVRRFAGALVAHAVRIWSRPAMVPVVAFGMVTSVNGSTATGACGTSGMSGTFTVMQRNTSQTVIDVTAATKYREHDVSSPSFANVCVNEPVSAAGTVTEGTFNANGVQIWSPPATS